MQCACVHVRELLLTARRAAAAQASTLLGAFLENLASEQSARMTAMDNASKNAGDLIERLTLEYNRCVLRLRLRRARAAGRAAHAALSPGAQHPPDAHYHRAYRDYLGRRVAQEGRLSWAAAGNGCGHRCGACSTACRAWRGVLSAPCRAMHARVLCRFRDHHLLSRYIATAHATTWPPSHRHACRHRIADRRPRPRRRRRRRQHWRSGAPAGHGQSARASIPPHPTRVATRTPYSTGSCSASGVTPSL